MIYVKPRTAAEMTLSVTGTAATLMSLIETAGSAPAAGNYYLSLKQCNVVRITPTDGDIRYAWEVTPTAAHGAYLGSGNYEFVGGDLSQLKLISTSGTVTVSLVYYHANAGELAMVSGGGGGSSDITSIIPGTGATNLGKAEDAVAASGDTGVAILERRIDTLASSAGADGDYAFKNQDSIGASYGREVYAPGYENNSLQRAMTLQGVSYTNISASALIKTGAGYLAGFVVNSASAGATIKLWDSTSAATTVLLNTITFTAAVNQGPTVVLLPSPAAFGTGLYCTIAVAAMDVTLLWL